MINELENGFRTMLFLTYNTYRSTIEMSKTEMVDVATIAVAACAAIRSPDWGLRDEAPAPLSGRTDGGAGRATEVIGGAGG